MEGAGEGGVREARVEGAGDERMGGGIAKVAGKGKTV